MRRISSPPLRFSGLLAEFYEQHVLPVLPSPEIVEYYHHLLLEFCAQPDPLFLIRYMRGTERRRIYVTGRGNRFRATDNAPAWWMHYTLFQGRRIPPNDFADTVNRIPAHLFDISASLPDSISAAGWHVAHIFPVKDGNIDYVRWSRAELSARFVRNVHPCNYFFVAKSGWQLAGGDERFIAFFAQRFSERYPTVWGEFVRSARVDVANLTRVSGPIRYEYDSAVKLTDEVEAPFSILQTAAVVETRADAVVSYRSNRLLFKAEIIEALEADQRFRVITPHGTFEFSKADFYREFPNVVASRSYRDAGVYHYPAIPRVARAFLVPGQADDV